MDTAHKSVPPFSELPRRGSRLTIGLLTSQLNRGFHRAGLLGVADAARSEGAHFLCFEGGVLASSGSPEASANILYDLVSPASVDGLVIWASALDWNVDEAQTEAFCRRFAGIPVVSVGRAFLGIPGVVVDNYQGMRDAVVHLIAHHGYRRIAFLRGPEGAREEELRFRAYCDALTAHDIPLDPRLISDRTNWIRPDGLAAVRDLLAVRKLQPLADFQAIVSVGDDMACGAMEALQAAGIRVPDDVAVTGFNDDDEGRAILPALTTVRQPVERMARAAVATLLELLAGRPVPEVVTLPLDLVVRRSCGCLSPGVIEAAARRSESGEPLAHRLANVTGAGADVAEMTRLVDGFLGDVTGGARGAFLATLNVLLQRHALAGRDMSYWQQVLSLMRSSLLAELPAAVVSAAEDLWQQARVLTGETASQARAYQRFRAEQDSRLLGDFSQRIQTAVDRDALMRMLGADLPGLGVSACYLALYENPQEPTGLARLFFACDATGRRVVSADETVFPASQLLPDSSLRTIPESSISARATHVTPYATHSLVMLPLYFQRDQLGFLLLAVDARGLAFSETLREQISSALAALFLREEIRRALESAEEANNLKSRFLATVSHELRTPLSLIVGTIEMMQHELTGSDAALPDVYCRDLASIGASAQHLAYLIGDVLDLASSQAGELRLVCQPLALGEALANVALLAEPMAREKGLAWRSDVPADLPTIWGDRRRLQQVTLNLVSNAVKFTEQGVVSLWAEAGKREVVVAVSDTGVGIPPAEQEIIFDEFRRSERTTRRGYGGMGLGLAISRRLIELHGGKIGVLSSGSDGAGSTFYFTLPVMAQPAIETLPPRDRGQTVLLLTQRGGEGQRLVAYLTSRGFQVEIQAISGAPDWFAHLVGQPPGAVVLDYEPAAEQGWQLIQTLKLNPATRDVPVLFCALPEGQESGAVLALDYLTKPIAGDELALALARQGVVCDDARPKTILIVDDDPAILDLHTRLVQSHVPGCRLFKAANGQEALAVMACSRPDLVLLDLMMPVMDGFGVLQAMREDEKTRHVPVIVLTAQILTRENMARLQHGVAAVLGKELFAPSEVLAQVEAALQRSKRLGSEAQRIVRQAMAYIHEHYAEPLTRDDLARHVAVNERYLTRCFKQEFGVSPITYLTRYRIKQAKTLLARGEMSVTDVALAVGFSDSGYFARVFRDEMGVTPSRFQHDVLELSSQSRRGVTLG